VAVKTLKVGSSFEEKVDFLSEAEMMKRFDHKVISRHFPHFSAGILNLPPFPSLLCWNFKSPAISLTSLLEF
jgi:hypothetical protein